MTLTETLRADLAGRTDEKALIEFVSRERAALRECWTPETGGRAWVHEHTALMDAVVRHLFSLSQMRTSQASGSGHPASGNGERGETADEVADTETTTPDARSLTPAGGYPDAVPLGIAVCATGGYGQRMLAPGSDLDITVIASRDDDPPLLRSFFSLVMDVLMAGNKIKVGYAFRTPADAESGTLDHHTMTALLDARYICGDGALFARFDRLFHQNLPVAEFLFRKEGEHEARRARFGGTPFVAEPDIKNGPGGMRDLQTAQWMAHVRFRRPGEALWRDLVRRKVITRDELREFLAAREFLLVTRIALHFVAGERRDLLSRNRQEEVAARLGYTDLEDFARRFYAATRHIAHIADKVVARCMDAPIPLADTGLSAVRRRIVLTDPARTDADPLWPFRALNYCQTHGLELSLATEEAIQASVSGEQRAVSSGSRGGAKGGRGAIAGYPKGGGPLTAHRSLLTAQGKAFLDLLTAPGDVGATLRRMRRTGLLGALLPELEACMGLVPGDPTHIYTVGEHSLCVLDTIIALRDTVSDDDPRLGTYKAALRPLDSLLPLLLSALLHDIGKQWPTLRNGTPARHEETGAERIPEICVRLGCPPDVAETTRFLVRYHLLLAETSRLRDLGRAETIRETARAMGGDEGNTPFSPVDRLRMLYIHTYADTSAVGPGVFSDMNARLLEELFLRTEESLTRSRDAEPPLDAGVRDERLDTVRDRLRRRLTRERTSTEAISAEAIREHIEAMPAAYLLNTPLEMMATHLAMVNRLRTGEPVVVEARTLPHIRLTDLTVVTHDDPAPGLLAKITGALLSCDIGIHTAQVFTREIGRGELLAIDQLGVDYRGAPLGPQKRAEAEEALRIVLRGEKTVAELLARRRRPFAPEQPIRGWRVEEPHSADYTLLDVEAPDENGIIYRMATLFSGFGWNIQAARVSAWGGNARLAFYLTDAAGERLPVDTVEAQMESVLGGPLRAL